VLVRACPGKGILSFSLTGLLLTSSFRTQFHEDTKGQFTNTGLPDKWLLTLCAYVVSCLCCQLWIPTVSSDTTLSCVVVIISVLYPKTVAAGIWCICCVMFVLPAVNTDCLIWYHIILCRCYHFGSVPKDCGCRYLVLVKGKGSPYLTAEHKVSVLIPVLGSRLPLLSTRPAVTFLAHRPVPVSLLGEQRHGRCEQFA